MGPFARLSGAARRAAAGASAWIARRWKAAFYVHLAVGFSLLIGLDAAWLHVTATLRQRAFDAMLRHRLVVPRPDPDIVIVDIDEASLAAMAKEYGRWPWPRQVLGEFLEHLERQRPRAVVFDILFSDPDVYNPDSDAYFEAAVAATANTFFPMLRLDEASDGLSQITPEMIPGAIRTTAAPPRPRTLAVVLPHFPAILQAGRLGFHNIYPDPDGVAREALVHRVEDGWLIPSLAARVVRDLGYAVPASPRVLLNWRGPPFSYRTVSFNPVFDDMLSERKSRPQDEFTNAIVLIGSTAPSLFDVKPTPMSRLHPGVEILATAIDNLKRGDFLRHPQGRVLSPLLALLIVWATGWAFYRNAGRGQIDRLFGASQVILLAVSYASINLTNTYVNLTGPVTVGLGYFTIARVYAALISGAAQASAVGASVGRTGELRATLLLVRLGDAGAAFPDGARQRIRRRLERSGTEPKSVEFLKGRQEGIWALFEDTLAVSWVIPVLDQAARARVERDVATVTASLQAILPRPPGAGAQAATWIVQEGVIAGGEAAKAGWRALFAEALVRWDQASRAQGGAMT